MSLLTLVLPVVGQPDSSEDPKVSTALTAIQTWANGNVDATNFAAGVSVPRVRQTQNTPTVGLVNTGALLVPTNACSATVTMANPGVVLVTAFAVVDLTAGTSAVNCGLVLGGAPIESARQGGVGSLTIQAQSSSNAAAVSLLFTTGDPVVGMGFAFASGAGDWSAFSTAAAQQMGAPIAIFLPAGASQVVALAYSTVSGTYTVVSQAIAVQAFC